jgi:purine-nucleoside/S-methyl-5'-thioadenosine phosphorylase / adenosine deaminase
VKVFRWDAGPGYQVAFSTRQGGVSEGPFESLNLGKLTRDTEENVEENRRRLCAALGVDAGRLTFNRQRHSAVVHRAVGGRRGTDGDGIWTDEPGVPMLAFTADCVPVAVVGAEGHALALLHVGWRGLLEGIVHEGVQALGSAGRAAVGPGIGPCCYEVGDEVAGPFRERFGDDVLVGRNLDLWTATERALRDAGVGDIDRFDLCTSCNEGLFFSHRRDGGMTGRQGAIGVVVG